MSRPRDKVVVPARQSLPSRVRSPGEQPRPREDRRAGAESRRGLIRSGTSADDYA